MSGPTPASEGVLTGEPLTPGAPTGETLSRRQFYGAILAGVLPIGLAGFGASGLANRPAFALWTVVASGLFTSLLYRSVDRGWPTRLRNAALLGQQAVVWTMFGLLMVRHREAWDLGLRAYAQGLYEPLVLSPTGIFVFAAGLALAALLILFGAAPRSQSRWRKLR
ncbi:MAG: hypothetical protein SX243_20165 [Acidobacteriota bacterium]|nr:hypothetical protein [Acidobacteriota bacterium]